MLRSQIQENRHTSLAAGWLGYTNEHGGRAEFLFADEKLQEIMRSPEAKGAESSSEGLISTSR
jgi:hypothetical protein